MDNFNIKKLKFIEGDRPDNVLELAMQALEELKKDPETFDAFEINDEDVTIVLSNQKEGLGIFAYVGDVEDGMGIPVPKLSDIKHLFEDDGDTGWFNGSMN